MRTNGTYVYCLVGAPRKPSLRGVPKGVPGTGGVRLLEDQAEPGRRDLRRWLIVADAPLDRFSEAAINRRLGDLAWVSRAAIAHEAVVEAFVAAPALLPMKLFTIFTSDDRALAHVARERPRVQSILNRVKGHDEWGLRVVLDRARAVASSAAPGAASSGSGYLVRKKALRDATAELAARTRAAVADLYDRLGRQAAHARRRGARDLPVPGGPLLLDAAFLVTRTRAARFRATVAREARRLRKGGLGVTLTGPWPPYSFLD